MKHVDDETFEATVLKSEKPVLVDFSAAWCGPCKIQKPVLARFAESHPELEVVLVDVDESPRTSGRYRVQAMPTLMLFQGGEPKAQVLGLQNEPRLKAFVESALAG
jgi:thioredoxin 1